MNENLNLLEILKDCPKETKFYSSYLGKDVLFTAIYDNCIECEYPFQSNSSNCIIQFRQDGSLYTGGECMLFPSKDQRDWSKWHIPFVDGDVLSYQNKLYKNRTIYIYRYHSKMNTSYYVALSASNDFMIGKDGDALNNYNDTARFATEEEKQKLFDVVKKNGYKWNEKTKTLEKLIEPKFKVGDRIISIENEGRIYTINGVYNSVYGLEELDLGLPINEQDNWELVPNKFDISTLIPYESKVLIRNTIGGYWQPSFWGAYIIDHSDGLHHHDYLTTKGFTHYCIPYDGNEHLLGTTDDCCDFYKTWEK